MTPILKTIAFGVGCCLLGGMTVEGFVSRTSLSSIAMPKSTTPKTTTPGGDTVRLRVLLLHPRDTNRHFGKQQQQQQLGVAVLRLASNNNNSDDVDDDVNKGDDADNDNTTTHQEDGVVVEVVTSSFDGTTGETTETTPISTTLQQDKNAIDPIVAVVAVTAGLVGSFVVLYFELQQARLL
ncbi:hypothetical protein FRACYDRAFT_235073 [Fragilariopsis cylindrus CCMP1102]|uniref:Uncharacterized protein n=1 Tax=Fragilariopsis cylindrus CCMP1102 TaxID=635003 RepID=A0A1E7FTK0_9STRA|nr:hypothetical protein FRACYDRAFT_235073 [Fragilariopsis cylindrus CCMP1102]|eukprot:OEU21447.1 hypothetical protein FRACYDRAFT_235073 [Fragilariopsis cylindrus CCMP1102]